MSGEPTNGQCCMDSLALRVCLKLIPLHAIFFKITFTFAVLHPYSESNKAKEISLTIFLFKNALENSSSIGTRYWPKVC